jgi:hypothetical protein
MYIVRIFCCHLCWVNIDTRQDDLDEAGRSGILFYVGGYTQTINACVGCTAGLPDGLFSNQQSQFGYILEGFGMKNVVIFMTTWNILRPLGKCCGNMVSFVVLVYFSRFGIFGLIKIWQPCCTDTPLQYPGFNQAIL